MSFVKCKTHHAINNKPKLFNAATHLTLYNIYPYQRKGQNTLKNYKKDIGSP